MTKNLLTLLLCCCIAFAASAQKITVTGTVTDKEGEPLIGASVTDKSAPGHGAVTDLDGHYSISVDQQAILTFSYIGYDAQDIAVDGRTVVDVVLKENETLLDEVVVIGYGTQNRSKMSSSVATISSKDVVKQTSSNVASALQGRAAGVDVVQQGGIAGADVNIVVRGAASLTATEPLYVIDGVFSNNGLTTLNPADIETIQVLKDGAAAAIYGSRAANGVVLITTKNGQKGSVKVDANFAFSVQTLAHTPQFLNASQWREFANMVSDNSGLARAPENVNPSNPSVDTDWVDEWSRNAPVYTADLAVSGGNDFGTYSFSLGYLNQEGMTLKSEYQKYNARTNSNWKFDRFFVSENAQIVWRKRTPTQTFNIGMPTLPVTDEYGRYASWGPEYYIETENARRNNPFGGLYATDQHTSYFDIMGGFSAGVEIIKGLKFTTSFSGNYTASHGYTHTPVYYTKWNEDGTPDNDYGNNRNSLSESRGQSSNYTWDNVFNFDREFGKHSISATLGHSWMREFYRGMSYNTINDLGAPNIVGVTNVDGKISSNEKNSALLSFFARVNYDFDGKYLLSASIRRDESSKFHKDYRTGYFPAVSAGWNIHNESWFKTSSLINYLKVRASYGNPGNQNYDAKLAASIYEFYNDYSNPFGIANIISQWGNSGLKWQKTNTYNVGLTATMFDNRLSLNADYQIRKTDPQLVRIDLPGSTGVTSAPMNIGGTDNRSISLSATFYIIKKYNFNWYISGNMNHYTTNYYGIGNILEQYNEAGRASTSLLRMYDGASTSGLYAVRSLGIDPATGNEMFLKKNGTPTYEWNSEDEVLVGDSNPDIQGNFSTSFLYKGITFGASFSFKMGGDVTLNTLMNKVENISGSSLNKNQDVRALTDRWKQPGDIAKYKRIDDTSASHITTRFIKTENTFSCGSINIGYRTSTAKFLNTIGATSFDIRFYMNDIFRISNIKEERGLSYPFQRSCSMSLGLSF